MSEFKTVSMEPTAEMVEAAEEAYMPFGDMDLAIRMALLTAHELRMVLLDAPAVQGEPSYKELYREFSEWCQNNRGLDMDCRLHTHGGPIDHGGYISDEKTRVAFAAYRAGRLLARQPAEQKPAPDVSALLEALEASTHRLHTPAGGDDNCRCGQCRFVRLRDAALSAHRKGDE